ncbi:GGDEF domain-containing protein [Shewanella aestuarii]|uniref:GGDEF domain-containing protein n=1 Tax=Shewanella aestuarii TaxID=1028752 RepID=A0A6G9QLZ8_9GAMM|nr:GGDEF domain-containing protein [Shewanella aestuarii]QIR15614.1 GGDEF domain-containing protein [Shewanella aestuarii]
MQDIKALSGKQFCPETVKAAIPVLEAMDIIPVDHNYLKDEFEEARLAYYYKDPLTGLYNYRYLEHIISFNEELFGKHYACCYFINLLNFGQYNQQNSWLAGDNLLCNIARKLTQAINDAAIFRVFGDDFLILTEQYIKLDAAMLEANLQIAQFGIELELHELDLQTDKISTINDFSKLINQFINQSKSNRQFDKRGM